MTESCRYVPFFQIYYFKEWFAFSKRFFPPKISDSLFLLTQVQEI